MTGQSWHEVGGEQRDILGAVLPELHGCLVLVLCGDDVVVVGEVERGGLVPGVQMNFVSTPMAGSTLHVNWLRDGNAHRLGWRLHCGRNLRNGEECQTEQQWNSSAPHCKSLIGVQADTSDTGPILVWYTPDIHLIWMWSHPLDILWNGQGYYVVNLSTLLESISAKLQCCVVEIRLAGLFAEAGTDDSSSSSEKLLINSIANHGFDHVRSTDMKVHISSLNWRSQASNSRSEFQPVTCSNVNPLVAQLRDNI